MRKHLHTPRIMRKLLLLSSNLKNQIITKSKADAVGFVFLRGNLLTGGYRDPPVLYFSVAQKGLTVDHGQNPKASVSERAGVKNRQRLGAYIVGRYLR